MLDTNFLSMIISHQIWNWLLSMRKNYLSNLQFFH